jgi:4-hydroxy-3-methylbut-2-enyl diphosphate reductase
MKVLLASPRGFCAGVERAIEIVERALEIFGPPVYVRKEIVHNQHVVSDLKQRGAVFVEELSEVPEDSVTIFSAHGVSPSVRGEATKRNLRVIDATCPLVAKVHMEAVRFAQDGDTILMIGHKGHEETEGTMGEAPDRMMLVESVDDVTDLAIPEDANVAVLTQTTLSVDDTRDILEAVEARFDKVRLPGKEDICYATQNRQTAVKVLAARSDVVLVIGAENSSNSQRLKEVARVSGARAHLEKSWFEGVSTVGITAGASAPEVLIEGLVEKLREWGATEVEEAVVVIEDVRFALPAQVLQV